MTSSTGSGASAGAGRARTSCSRNRPACDAIFCGSDQIARGVSDTLRMLGRRVPDDIALIGYDNWEPMAAGPTRR